MVKVIKEPVPCYQEVHELRAELVRKEAEIARLRTIERGLREVNAAYADGWRAAVEDLARLQLEYLARTETAGTGAPSNGEWPF